MNTELLDLANQIVASLQGKLQLNDPIVLTRLLEAGVAVAAAPDDETRRGIIQAEVLRLETEFGGQK